MAEELVAADIGGTHARFALAQVERGRVLSVGEPTVLRTGDFPRLEDACAAFARALGRSLPRSAALAVAGPVDGETLRLTNSAWVIRRADLARTTGFDRSVLVNDFGAVAHAAAQLPASAFCHLCGPDAPLPTEGVVTVVGPGTGLGVAQLVRRDGRDLVVETEGGHVGFAPLDAVEDEALQKLRERFGRVSNERLASGPGLATFYAGTPPPDAELWSQALEGRDPLARVALERFCAVLGAVAGDLALAHGAHAVVVGGGLGLRLADRLPASGFAARFTAKGRFEARMAKLPVKTIVHPEPGLFGAAAAFATRYAG